MLTLAVTSSTSMVGAALVERINGSEFSILASEQSSTDRRHAEELTPMIASVLSQAGRTVREVERFAVDIGPGRFTGLRVGLTTVRTLALAVDRPVVGITSLETLAAAHPGRTVASIIDARRAEVFQQRFGASGPLDAPGFGQPEAMAARLQPGDLLVGDGADRYAEVFAALDVEHLLGQEPSAELVGRLSLDRPGAPGPSVVPLYLRDPDVQINIKTRHNT